jgi:hypothetical protein
MATSGNRFKRFPPESRQTAASFTLIALTRPLKRGANQTVNYGDGKTASGHFLSAHVLDMRLAPMLHVRLSFAIS